MPARKSKQPNLETGKTSSLSFRLVPEIAPALESPSGVWQQVGQQWETLPALDNTCPLLADPSNILGWLDEQKLLPLLVISITYYYYFYYYFPSKD